MKNNKSCCVDVSAELGEYRIESVVSVDERGQMVLPKEVREKLGIGPGDKLALAIMHKSGRACCATLIKVEELAVMVNDFLGPVSDVLAKKSKITRDKGL